MAGTSIYVPSLGSMKKAVITNKTAMTGLAVVFVASFAGMVINAYCSDHINKSSCIKTDKSAKDAKRWATGGAVINGILTAGSLAAMGYLVYTHSAKKSA